MGIHSYGSILLDISLALMLVGAIFRLILCYIFQTQWKQEANTDTSRYPQENSTSDSSTGHCLDHCVNNRDTMHLSPDK